MKTFGTLALSKDRKTWIIDCEPHIVMRLKRVFPKVSRKAHGAIRITNTIDTCRELDWFTQRFPLVTSTGDLVALQDQSQKHQEQEGLVNELITGIRAPSEYLMALQPRPYQRIAGDVVYTQGGLLLADDLGLGKTCSGICLLSRADCRPALVVTMTHLTYQWEREIKKFVPGLVTHVLKKGTPYDLRATKRTKPGQLMLTPETPDVIITNYHKLSGWADTLAPMLKSVIYDEAQELRHSDSAKYKAAEHISGKASWRMGLSVGPESELELQGGPFGNGWVGPIEQAWSMVDGPIVTSESYELRVVPARDILSRGWNGDGFTWKPVKTFIRHKCDKPVRRINTGGSSLLVTDDHSVFSVTTNDLVAKTSDRFVVGDMLATDNGANWGCARETTVNVVDLVKTIPRCQVAVDLLGHTRKEFGLSAWEWQNCHKEATYGTRLPVDVFLRNRSILPEPSLVYLGRGKAPFLPAKLRVSDWAYVLGFFLGDGWVTKDRVAFAVELAIVEQFTERLEKLGIGLRPKIRRMPGASVEVRCSHRLFAAVIGRLLGGAKCFEKRIPSSWIASWPAKARLELLKGLTDSDGYVSKCGNSAAYVTTSKRLALDVQSLLRSLGVTAGLNKRKPAVGGTVRGRRINGIRVGYQVHWSQNSLLGKNEGHHGKRHRFEWTKGKLNETPIRSIEQANAPEYVYDLEMTGHPSFTANGVLVHNTATPIYNYGDELFHVINCIMPGRLGTKGEFIEEWCKEANARSFSISDPKAFGAYARDSGIMLQRTRAEVGRELPPLTKIPMTIECNTKALEAIEGAAGELARIIMGDTEEKRGQKMQASEELSGLVRQATGIAKAPYVAAFVRMLVESGKKVVLWGWHRAVYDLWIEALKDLKPVLYTGSESPTQKEAARVAFVEGDAKVLVMSLRSGAGLDGLQEVCDTGVYGELDWSPGVHDQCGGRIHRDGQDKHTFLYFLIAEEGSDPIVADVLGLKKAQSDGVMGERNDVLDTSGTNVKALAKMYLASKAAA